ncbi:MAG: protein arginine kinase [Clostridioides sp.]|jgi:protein arginine kinase|nr:protein arginine kinase [Clostridioides sp.]
MGNDVIIKSRVRLARNLNDYLFPHILGRTKSLELIEKVKEAFFESEDKFSEEFDFYKMEDMGEVMKLSLVEDHLISPDIVEKDDAAVIINKDRSVSIMINEEDHIRIQTMSDGLNLENAYETASRIDDILEEKLNYAFDIHLGYLTTCPINTGTGMKASVMMHLPALTSLKYMSQVHKVSAESGMKVRGIYGERTEALGNIYQLSNQLTLGKTENSIIEDITQVSEEIVSKELQARSMIQNTKGIEMEDQVYRALGILQNARVIDTKEAMKHLSSVKVGIEMGYIQNLNISDIDGLMIEIQPAHQSIMFELEEISNRDVNRAKYIRETFEKLKIGVMDSELQ